MPSGIRWMEPVTAPRDPTLALEIVRSLGARASSIREIVGRGTVNHVFVVDTETPDGRLVVRFRRDPLDTDDHAKEAWCLRAALAHGVPVPEPIAVGSFDGVAYIVQRFVEGDDGETVPSRQLWRTLGRYARAISTVTLDASAPDSLFPRFGRDLAANWQEHVAYNVTALGPGDPLIELGVYPAEEASRLKALFEALAERVHAFGLVHGDLVPTNVVVPADGHVVLLDWGSAHTGPVPYEDLQRIWARPSSARGALDAFAEGYGVSAADFVPALPALRLLEKVDKVRWALDRRPDKVATLALKARRTVHDLLGPDGGGFVAAVDLFNAGAFWEAHEVWERLWRVETDAATRNRLQGLILAAAACLKLSLGRRAAFATLAARAQARLVAAGDSWSRAYAAALADFAALPEPAVAARPPLR
jgi:aminoglycoside phosphotransferase (APT) family kinase protein